LLRRLTVLLLLTCGFSSFAGCATAGTYWQDRWLDFADCFKGDVGYGFGAGAHVRATNLFSAGVGGGYMWKHGFKGRQAGKWTDVLLGWPASNVVFAFNVIPDMYEGSTTIGNNGSDVIFGIILCIPMNYAGVGRLIKETADTPPHDPDLFEGGYYTHSIFGLNILALRRGDPSTPEEPFGRYGCPPIEMFDIEVGAMAGLVGVHIGFSLGQFADFFCGWFGLDIAGDDIRSEPATPPEDEDPEEEDE
jgi:hypothetical protein